MPCTGTSDVGAGCEGAAASLDGALTLQDLDEAGLTIVSREAEFETALARMFAQILDAIPSIAEQEFRTLPRPPVHVLSRR